MKAIVTFVASLMITTTLIAQPSRRSESNTQDNRRSESASRTDRRTPSESKSTEVSSRKSAEPGTRTQTPPSVNQEKRGNSPSTMNPPSSRRNESSPSSRVQEPEKRQNTSVTNRREPQSPSVKREENNSPRHDNGRREPNKPQVIVVDNHRPVERHHTVVHKSYRPVPVEVRRVRNPYRAPVRAEIIWTVDLSRRYEVYYPHYHFHTHHVGSRIASISAYDAYDFVGEIARVYGRVNETYYSHETDELFLYIGDYYPYQDFTVVLPAREAREFSRRPERFFNGEYIEVTGLISRFQGKPEMLVRRAEQIAVY